MEIETLVKRDETTRESRKDNRRIYLLLVSAGISKDDGFYFISACTHCVQTYTRVRSFDDLTITQFNSRFLNTTIPNFSSDVDSG
ncbi:Protein CBG25742 [Caenorhabditis briggsae]|uniref:Protein CBG25742 n=1 Tax=Caenorhabditis briggsae TaxID=6238 RepID=B6IHR3_CAEBR|nr:Protein CBG25742 [Caenorhabditis briggsae]CAR99443.1 Protein CBG25742 [Caenorhabditis briggsae]